MNEVIIRSSPNCFLHIFYAIFKNVCKNGVCCKNYNLFIHLHCFVCTFYDHQHTTQEEKCKTQTLGEAETGTKFL